jgi:SSS family solute:Na+ symporter
MKSQIANPRRFINVANQNVSARLWHLKGPVWMALTLVTAAFPAPGAAAAEEHPVRFTWTELPPLPPAPDQAAQPGVAGPFVGAHNGALIVAGGANFPDAPPWEGGKKTYWDSLFVLVTSAGGAPEWIRDARHRIPRPLAYGAAVDTPAGVLCIGGCDADRCYADCFLLRWDSAARTVTREPMPALPRPLAFMAAARIGSSVTIAGGQEAVTGDGASATAHVFALDLQAPGGPGASAWKPLSPWPGPPRILPVAAAQFDGTRDCFFLFSGRHVAPGRPTELLTDAYAFDPGRARWRRLADVSVAASGTAGARCIMAGAAVRSGAAHLLVIGGARGDRFLELERLGAEIDRADAEAGRSPDARDRAEALRKRQREILTAHPGFSRDVLAYHAITDTWAKVGELPGPGPVTTAAAWWDGAVVVPSGEVRPGVRSAAVWAGTAVHRRPSFGVANYATLLAYPLVMLAVSWFVGKKRTSDEFFRGGQRIPWWAVGLSIYATLLSSLTFMAIPAKAYMADWAFALVNVAPLLLAPIVIYCYLPFFRGLDVTSAYEYLERRFNLAVRWFGGALFIAFQLGRTAIVLYLPALALATVCSFGMWQCILLMGVICLLMTYFGGIEAVVWTDVAQSVILLIAAAAVLLFAVRGVPGGAAGCLALASAGDKGFGGLEWTADLTIATGWVILIGNLIANLCPYTASQDVVQRYVSTRDLRASARSIWANGLMVIPTTALFFSVGTALWAFYKSHPERLDPAIANDAILPLFLVCEMPPGWGGLVVAGIFAAAQPTGNLNSIATVWVADFHGRMTPRLGDAARLASARLATVAAAVLGTAIAIAMTCLNLVSLWETFIQLLGLTGSTLAGLFALGIFTRRANGRGALAGAAISVAALLYVQHFTRLHFFAYAAVGTITCFGVGWLLSLLMPARQQPLAGLTLYTLGAGGAAPGRGTG